jgi:hypothetical protein
MVAHSNRARKCIVGDGWNGPVELAFHGREGPVGRRREEIDMSQPGWRPRENIRLTSPLPHEAVFVRLGVSALDGIGVFAIRPIPRGTRIFANETLPVTWVEKDVLDRIDLDAAQARLYRDFGINQGDRIGCPMSFNFLTPSWYLNEPAAGAAANVATDPDLNFFTCRDIEEGEELTIVYSDFSEPLD